MNTPRKIVVFYDDPCIDGSVSAKIVKDAFKDNPAVKIVFVPISYGSPQIRTQKILSHLSDGAEVIFLDTSPKDDTLEILFNPETQHPRIKKLTIFDHHPTEVARIQDFARALRSKLAGSIAPNVPELELFLNPAKSSAALIVWDHFNRGKPAPSLLGLVGRIESSTEEPSRHDKEIMAYFDSLISLTPEETFNNLETRFMLTEEEILPYGRAIFLAQKNNIEKSIKTSFRYAKMEVLPGRSEWVPLVTGNVLSFGRGIDDALVKEAQRSTTFGVAGAWFVQKDGTVKLSLRSRGAPDVGRIAKHLGITIGFDGGGRTKAACVYFTDLLQFAQNVKTYSKEEMMAIRSAESVGVVKSARTPQP